MKRFASICACFGLTACFASGSAAWSAPLKAGDPAPNFELTGNDGKQYKLSDFKNKQAVVIAWYPKAFTGG